MKKLIILFLCAGCSSININGVNVKYKTGVKPKEVAVIAVSVCAGYSIVTYLKDK